MLKRDDWIFCQNLETRNASVRDLHRNFWRHNWTFCQRLNCSELASLYSLHDLSSARQWLQQVKESSDRMHAMRDLLSRETGTWNLQRMSDDTVLDVIAELLISWRLHIHLYRDGSGPDPGAAANDAVLDAILAGSPAKAPAPLPPPAAVAPAPAVAPTFSSGVDLATQASLLAAAAATGAPACYI
jgi:hypothetical protein